MSNANLIERLTSHMGKADVQDLLRDCRLAADALAAKDTALSEMRAELERHQDEEDKAAREMQTVIQGLRDRATAAEAQLERARKALEPFGLEAAGWEDMWLNSFVPSIDTGHCCENCGHSNKEDIKAKFTVGDLRAARALASQDEGE